MAPPTAKEQYDRLRARLSRQHQGVGEGSTSPVSERQFAELSGLEDAMNAERGLTAPGDALAAARMMEEVRKREIAVEKREDEVKRREFDYEQQEAVVESLREEVKMWREKDALKTGGRGGDGAKK